MINLSNDDNLINILLLFYNKNFIKFCNIIIKLFFYKNKEK